jgi:hypothetical protein
LRDRLFEISGNAFKQAKALANHPMPYLKQLQGMSRSVGDWIQDNIIQPLYDRKLLGFHK